MEPTCSGEEQVFPSRSLPKPVGRPPAHRSFPLRPGFRCTAGTGPQIELSAGPLNPRRSLPHQDKSPPSQQAPGPPTSQRGARDGYLARTSRAADGALAGAARPSVLQPKERRDTCSTRLQNGLAAPGWTPPQRPPPPAPAPRSASPTGLRLCYACRVSPFPGRGSG